jgi:hypothetical protein
LQQLKQVAMTLVLYFCKELVFAPKNVNHNIQGAWEGNVSSKTATKHSAGASSSYVKYCDNCCQDSSERKLTVSASDENYKIMKGALPHHGGLTNVASPSTWQDQSWQNPCQSQTLLVGLRPK